MCEVSRVATLLLATLLMRLEALFEVFATSCCGSGGETNLCSGRLFLWVNVLEPGGSHTGHIHPHCVMSGTYYVRVPDGASSLKFEDPRLAMMMAAPAPREDADDEHRRFVYVAPRAGEVLLWESWLRHEVTVNRATTPRISISFNYRV